MCLELELGLVVHVASLMLVLRCRLMALQVRRRLLIIVRRKRPMFESRTWMLRVS